MADKVDLQQEGIKVIAEVLSRHDVIKTPGGGLTAIDVKAMRSIIADLQSKKKRGSATKEDADDYGTLVGLREMLMSGHLSVDPGEGTPEEISAAEFRRASEEAIQQEAVRKSQGYEGQPDRAPVVAIYRSKIYNGQMRVIPDTRPPASISEADRWVQGGGHSTPILDTAEVLLRLRLRSEGMPEEEASEKATEILSQRDTKETAFGSDAYRVAQAIHEEGILTDEERRMGNQALRQILSGEDRVFVDDDAEYPRELSDRKVPTSLTPAQAGVMRANLAPEKRSNFSEKDAEFLDHLEKGVFLGHVPVVPTREFEKTQTRKPVDIEEVVEVVYNNDPSPVRLAKIAAEDASEEKTEELKRRSSELLKKDADEAKIKQQQAKQTNADGRAALEAIGIDLSSAAPKDGDEIQKRILSAIQSSEDARLIVSGRDSLTPESEKMEAITNYLDILKAWERAANASEHDTVQYLLDRRIQAVEKLRDIGAVGSSFLSGTPEGLKGDVSLYLASDIGELDSPEKGDPEWTVRKEQMAEIRNNLRDGLESEVKANRWNPNSNGGIAPEHFAELTRRAADMIASGENIGDQRRVVEIMRNEVVAHSFRGQFIMDVMAETDADNSEKTARDELLAGFGWSKAIRNDYDASLESAPVAEAIKASTNAATGIERLKHFQRVHALGKEIETNPPAVIALHEQLKDDDWAWNVGRAALIEQRFDKSVINEYRKELSREQLKEDGLRSRDANDPVRVFASAFYRFQQDFEVGDERMALSVNAMRVSAKRILESGKDIDALTGGDNELAAALLEFSGDREDEVRKNASTALGAVVDDMVKTQGLTKAPIRNFREDADAPFREDDRLVIEAISGDTVMIASSKEDMENGNAKAYRLAGLVAPPDEVTGKDGKNRPVMTKDGSINAGQSSHENLVGLISRFDVKNLSVEIMESKSGEKNAQITLPGGRTLADEQIRQGYGLARAGFGDTDRRHESLANRARSNQAGLNANGFPDLDESWRSHDNAPKLSLEERRDKISKTVFSYFASDARTASEMLRRPETQFMALPLKAWSAGPLMEREMRAFVRENPNRAIDMYENSCQMLDEIFAKKEEKGLKNRERYAADYVNRGRAMLGAALAAENEIDLSDPSKPKKFEERNAEDLKKYPSLTEEARAERRERFKKRAQEAAKAGGAAVKRGASELGKMGNTLEGIAEGLI